MKNINKKTFSLFIILLLMLTNVANTKAQLSPEGKTYVANVRSTCKMMEGGGCSIDEFCSMTFTKNKVSIFNYTKASCSPKSRERYYNQKPGAKTTYNWSMESNIIHIENFDEYGNYEVQETKLMGKKNTTTSLEFLKQ